MFAIFDLDKTLINQDSTTLWSQWLCQNQRLADPATYLAKEAELMAQYDTQQLNIADYIQLTLQPVLSLPIAEINHWVDQFITEQIVPRIYTQGLALIEQHRSQGHKLLMVSASASLLVKPIGKRCFHMDEAFGIDVAQRGGYYSDNLLGIVPYQQGKVDTVRAYLSRETPYFPDCYFYSDSINDAPLLRAVGFPHVVNPDPLLAALAQRSRWPIHCFEQVNG